jgi:hypothetical protein
MWSHGDIFNVVQQMQQSDCSNLNRMGGPLKPAFGLSGAVLRLDRVFQPLVRVTEQSLVEY